jgi:hypothetical protein
MYFGESSKGALKQWFLLFHFRDLVAKLASTTVLPFMTLKPIHRSNSVLDNPPRKGFVVEPNASKPFKASARRRDPRIAFYRRRKPKRSHPFQTSIRLCLELLDLIGHRLSSHIACRIEIFAPPRYLVGY